MAAVAFPVGTSRSRLPKEHKLGVDWTIYWFEPPACSEVKLPCHILECCSSAGAGGASEAGGIHRVSSADIWFLQAPFYWMLELIHEGFHLKGRACVWNPCLFKRSQPVSGFQTIYKKENTLGSCLQTLPANYQSFLKTANQRK